MLGSRQILLLEGDLRPGRTHLNQQLPNCK
jgi:tRNA A37 threonylcarbamoyladenosine biosynthesis protein TsaE